MKSFSPKLDKISENIIYLFSLDSRQTVSALAEELKLNRKIVEHRVNKLFRERCVKPITITNEAGRICFTMFIKLRIIDETTLDKIKKLSGLLKLKETLGLYDLSILFSVYDQKDMEETISKLSNILHNKILSYEVVPHTFEDTLGYKSFCHDAQYLQKYALLEPKAIILSDKEVLVLEHLKKNTLISYAELSKQTGIVYLKLKEIQDKLIQNDLIRFSLDPDYDKLGLNFHNILIKMKLGKKEAFEQYLKTHPRIHWVKYSKGRWDYVLSVTARSINEFIDISKQIRADNNNLILDETSLITKVEEMRKY
ncbi:Lrp/AsnC family transcriptional regulator [Candidatus Woesearchaeota archaeon]|nr:Lrp/AsnC family transcriptional regulator [Candidatus Woesearchaeota archaeon]